MATATIQVAYEAETTSLKATVNEINQINDKVVEGAQQSASKVKKSFEGIANSFTAAFSGGEAKKAIDNQKKAIDGLTNSGKSLTGQLRGLKAELSNLEIAGQDGTQAFNELLIAAAKLEDQIGDTRAKVKILASDTFKFDAAVGATQALASGFELAQGAAALFGSESEDLQKAIVKITAATAVANGVQQLATLIKEESAVKTAVLTAATAAYNVVVGTSTGALRLFKLALAGTGIGLLVLALSELVGYFMQLQSESAKTQTVFERFKDTFANAKTAIEGYRDAIINSQERIDVALGRTSNLQSSVNKQRRDEAKQLGKDLTPLILAQEKLRSEYEKELAIVNSPAFKVSSDDRIEALLKSEKIGKELAIVEAEVTRVRTAGRAAIDLNTKAIVEEEKAVIRSKTVKRDAIVETIKLETIAFKGSVSRKEEEIKLNLQVSTLFRDNLNADNALRVAQLELEKSLNGESLENTIATIKAKAKAEADALGLTSTDSVKRQKINADADKAITAARNEETNKQIALLEQYAAEVSNILGSLNEISQAQSEKRIADIEAASAAELEAINASSDLERDKIRSRDALAKRTAQRIAEEKTKQARQDKALALFEIGINTASAVIKAIAASPTTFGLPFSAFAAAAGLAQAAVVAAKPLPKFEKGGLIGGKLHSQGGTLIEAEQGEYMVNRRQSAKHRRELDAMNTSTEAFRRMIDEKYVRPALMSYSAGRRGKEGVTVNASLNSKSMEKELRGVRKDLKNRNVIVNINQQDSRYTWQ
jgi:hypothetical protein